MDRPPPTAPTVPVRRHDRWPGGLVVLALGFILVAIAKPWPASPVEPPASPDAGSVVCAAGPPRVGMGPCRVRVTERGDAYAKSTSIEMRSNAPRLASNQTPSSVWVPAGRPTRKLW